MAWPAPSRENHRKVRPQGSQVLKGLGFSALRFDFKKEMRKEHLRIRNKKNHVHAQAAKKKKKKHKGMSCSLQVLYSLARSFNYVSILFFPNLIFPRLK